MTKKYIKISERLTKKIRAFLEVDPELNEESQQIHAYLREHLMKAITFQAMEIVKEQPAEISIQEEKTDENRPTKTPHH